MTEAVLLRGRLGRSFLGPPLGGPERIFFGSPQWWALVDEGRLPEQSADGVIERVYWGSMGDWPEFTLRDLAGRASTWTREGDLRRYVEGLRARVDYVELERQPGAITADLDPVHQMVVKIWVEESRVRGPAIAPGPGAVG